MLYCCLSPLQPQLPKLQAWVEKLSFHSKATETVYQMMLEASYSLLTLVNTSRPIWPRSTSPKCFLAAKFITTNTHVINGGQNKEICWRGGGNSCRVKWKRSIHETPSITSSYSHNFLFLTRKRTTVKHKLGNFVGWR